MTHYDPTFIDNFLDLKNISNKNPVLSKTFSFDYDNIVDLTFERESDWEIGMDDITRYMPCDKELIKKCNKHITQFSKPLDSPNVLILVHPFMLQMSHFEYIKDKPELLEQVRNEYLKPLVDFLRLNSEKKLVDVIVLETLGHYASFTNVLLENDLIQQAYLTRLDQGHVLDIKKYQNEILDKNVFLAGSYNSCCISASLQDLPESQQDKYKVVKDLILQEPFSSHPIYNNPLYPLTKLDSILGPDYKKLPNNKMSSLEEMIIETTV